MLLVKIPVVNFEHSYLFFRVEKEFDYVQETYYTYTNNVWRLVREEKEREHVKYTR